MRKWLFWVPWVVFGSVNEPICLQLLSGYRNDTIDLGAEKFDNLQFWENDLALRYVHRDILIYLKGGYSAFGRGTFKPPESSTSGWAVDGMGHFGYTVNLTPDRTYAAMVIPLVGFSGHYETINFYDQTWFGPYVGGALRAKPGNGMTLEAGYAYNWLHLNALEVSDWGNYGQTGWLEFDYRFARFWSVGLFGQINYFHSGFTGDKNVKLRWSLVEGSIAISRQL